MKKHCKCLLHRWEIRRETVAYMYMECVICGKRKIESRKVDYFEPKNYEWLLEEE
jgi:hypothetical protein